MTKVDPKDEQVRWCKKCGHADVAHGPKGCKGGGCLCWLTLEDMQWEENLEPKKG